jgi:16S rRNA (uracil1498-N3)-methyltransferase
MVGPEGGFSEPEFTAVRGLAQTRAISLGPRTLRAETAAIAALVLVQAFAGTPANLSSL